MIFALLFLLFAVAAVYIIYFGLVAKPEFSIYSYVLIWIIVPKAFRLFYLTGGVYDLPEGLTAFHIIELIAVLGIAIALIKHRRKSTESMTGLRRLTGLFVLAATISLIASFGYLSLIIASPLDDFWSFVNIHSELQTRFITFAAVIHAAVVAYGCIAFIRDIKKVETILLLFLSLGLILTVESLVFFYLPLFTRAPIPPALAAWSVQQASNRFMSIIFTNFDQVGMFSIVAVGCCAYFSLTRRKAFALLVPLLFLPIFAGYQRSVLLGVLATLLFIYWHNSTGRKRAVYVSLAFVGIITMYLVDSDSALLSQVAAELGGAVRPDYFSADSMEVRFGLQLRAIELFIHTFPFGTGPGLGATAMNSPIRHSVLGFAFPQIGDVSASIYGQVSTGTRTTNPHNSFLEFILENGLLGLVALTSFFYFVVRNFLAWLRDYREGGSRHSRLNNAQICMFAILLGLGMHEAFESTFFPYSFYVMFLYFTFLIPQLSESAQVGEVRSPSNHLIHGDKRVLALSRIKRKPAPPHVVR